MIFLQTFVDISNSAAKLQKKTHIHKYIFENHNFSTKILNFKIISFP